MTYAAFRNGRKVHTQRPACNERAARWAWDYLTRRGALRSMILIDGDWFGERTDGELDTVGADVARYNTR